MIIDGLKPYAAYKDSDAPWLGRIPAHWSVVRSKRMFSARQELARPNDVQLSATQAYGVIPQAAFEAKAGRRVVRISMHLEKRRHVEKDDFVISMRSFQGGLERAWASGCIRSSYVVLKPGPQADVGFFAYLFKSADYIRALQSMAGFIRDGQDLNFSDFCSVALPVVPFKEQQLIGRFLANADGQIRRYVRAKKNLIALLNEQKRATIQRAVTRGLNPGVHFKSSRVDWIGDVPEHWQIVPLRRRWTITDCKHLTVPFVEDGIPLASVREVQAFDLDLQNANRTTREWYQQLIEGGRKPRKGDLIYCRNVSVGAAAMVKSDSEFAMGQDVCMIRSSSQNQRYLNYFIHSPSMERQLALLLVGSTFDRINVGDIKALIVVVPPRPEQDAIVAHLDAALRGTERAVADASREISLLREYQLRLIADVVTGKIDVREAAAHLPDAPRTLEDDGLLLDEGTESDSPELNDGEAEVIA